MVEAKLYNGTQLWVDEQGTEWSAVTVKNTGVSGYVMTRYLKLYNLPSRPTRRVVHPAGGSYVNLRTSPDMTYGQIAARVPTGNSVTIMIPGQDWVQGDVERVHRLYADLFPAAVRAVSRGSRAFQKSHPHRRHTMASSQREHR